MYLCTYSGNRMLHSLPKSPIMERASALVFISGLQVTHPLYKHLLKNNIAKMSEALSWAQPSIQLDEAMKTSPSIKPSEDRKKSKSALEAPDYVPERHRGQPPYK